MLFLSFFNGLILVFVCVTSALLSGAKVRRKSHTRKETAGAGGILKLQHSVCQRITKPLSEDCRNRSENRHLIYFSYLEPRTSHLEKLPCADLTYPQALAYLRGEALVLPPDTPRGLVTVTFMGHPLGQVKNIGTRANNLYPKEWRIKTTHVPTDYEPVLTL